MELGTHMMIEAFVKRSKASEYRCATPLLRRAPANSLLLMDRGFYGYSMIHAALNRGVALLGRVGDHVTFERVKILADGSFLARIYPTAADKRRQTNALIIRVIEYTFDDPNRPGHGQVHRLFTTLLDDQAYPATELIVLYHERWEQELAHDEIKTHQLSKNLPTHLRSLTPVGVVQEFYGLLIGYNAVRQLMHQAA
jgi:hypothetical protein